jgi:flagellar biosynthesis protein FlhG
MGSRRRKERRGKKHYKYFPGFLVGPNGQQTILMDVDLGGANLHTLLRIKSPPRTINDFITKRYNSLEDICINTEIENFRLISGASEILSLANLQFAQKTKIIQHISLLDADYIVLVDLGAGTSFNVLDFFLVADKEITVLTPQPISIQNTYAFVRNAVYRKLSRLSSRDPSLHALIKTSINTKNELKMQTVKELFQFIQELSGEDVAESLRKEIEEIQPEVITNMVRNPRDKNAGRIIQLVAEKYLMVYCTDLGGVDYDRYVYAATSGMAALTRLDQSSNALACTYV